MKLRLVPRRLRNKKKVDEDECTVVAPETVCSSDCENNTPLQIPRHVCFDEEENVYHESHLVRDDIRSLWFTKDDFVAFNKENKCNVKRLRATECNSEDPLFWSRALCRLYWAFQEAKCAKDLQGILDSTKLTLDEDKVGVEHLVVKPVFRDAMSRRENILDQIMTLQAAHFDSDTHRAQAIANFMKSQCRPSRIYAMYIAHVAAGMH